MKSITKAALIVFACLTPLAATAEDNDSRAMLKPSANVKEITADWPEVAKQAANDMVLKYGEPTVVSSEFLYWKNNGPWEFTKVAREPVSHSWPSPHQDVITQGIKYEVPADKLDELAKYDSSVTVFGTRKLMAAECGGEKANFLALNLAHEIVTGVMTVDEAKSEYQAQMNNSGKSDKPYTERLLIK